MREEDGNQILQLQQEIKSLEAKMEESRVLLQEKELMDEENRRSKKRFETIFNESSLGNKIIDGDLRIIKVNKALLDILKYTEKELLGRYIIDIAHPNFKEDWVKLRDELWTNQRKSFSIDTCIIRGDKSTLWCHVTSIIFEDYGKTLGYTSLEDISERKRLEQAELDLKEKNLLIEQQQELFKATLNAQETERQRIAEGLHNGLGQLLFATKIQLNQVDLKSLGDNNRNAIILKRTEELLSDCIRESRRISHQLMPTILHDFGLKVAIEAMCTDMSGTIKYNCKIHLSSVKKDKYFEIVVYRLVQELMLNVGKHAEATECKITIEENKSELNVTVEDNGKGFDINKVEGAGVGILTIRNNISLLKGILQFSSTPGIRTAIIIRLPKQGHQ